MTSSIGVFTANVRRFQSATTLKKVARYTDYNQNPSSQSTILVADATAIKQSLDNLFNCSKYRRRYLPDYYVPIDAIIGELYNTVGMHQAIDNIIYYVELNEPRVSCDAQLSELNVFEDKNKFKLDLVITIPSLSTANQYLYSLENPIAT